MALTTAISTRELARIAAACFEGKRVRVSLASEQGSGANVESTLTAWDAIKVSGNGYADFTAVVATGAFDATDDRYEMGGSTGANTYIDATFTATGAGYSFDRVYVVIGTIDGETVTEEAYLHSLLTESQAIIVSAGQTITYRIQLAVA
jgi:hypothetical protein